MNKPARFTLLGTSLALALAAQAAHADSMRRIPYARAVLATGTANVHYIKPDGQLYSWGDNAWGELANGGVGTVAATPQKASNLAGFSGNLVQVVGGAHFAHAITKTGTLYGWGRNDLGQVGLSGATQYNNPVVIASSGVRAVADGYTHAMMIKDGYLYGWGTNAKSALCGATTGAQIATPQQVPTGNRWMTVSSGDRYNMIIDGAGNLYGCGYNVSGQLGTGSTAEFVAQPSLIGSGNDHWVHVSAGGDHVAAIKDDGSLWTWGGNVFGQLGLGSAVDHFSTPQKVSNGPWKTVSAGAAHTMAIKADGTLWAWGVNNHYQLGIGANTANQLSPVRVGTMSNWEQISAGFTYSTGVSARGELSSWGIYYAAGRSTSADVPAPNLVFSNAKPGIVVAGDDTSLEVRSNGSLYTWGDNTYGQLGLSSTGGFRTVPTPTNAIPDWVSLAGGLQNNYGVKADGSLWSWGRNANGELGFGDTTLRAAPTKVSTAGWTQVSACNGHVFALRADGTMYAWGVNTGYALGDNTLTQRLAPVQIGASVVIGGKMARWVAVACGATHAIAVASDGNSYSWGTNNLGALGLGATFVARIPTVSSTSSDYVSIGTHDRLSAALTVQGNIRAWGAAGVVGDGTNVQRNAAVSIGTGFKYLDLTVGIASALARKADGSTVGWGLNTHGQLGDGTKTNRTAPSFSAFPAARSLSLTRWTTLTLDPNGSRSGGGSSSVGQVGNGSSGTDVISPAPIGGSIFTY